MKKTESKQMVKKFSAKSTVKELLAFLDHVVDNPVLLKHLDKPIKDRIAYTKKAIQNREKVLKSDLVLLCNDAFLDLSKKETAIAKDAVKWAKSSEKKTEPKPELENTAEKQTEKKKPVKKSAEKAKSEPKKAAEKPELFIKSFEDEDGMIYRLLDVKTLDEFKELQKKGYSLVFATSWTESDLEKFDYGGHQITKKSDRPKKFENSLDLLQPVYIADRLPTIIAISLYTECAFSFRGDEFKKMDSNGMPFRVYVVTDPKESSK